MSTTILFFIFLCTFAAMKAKLLVILTTIMAFVSCHESYEYKTVICIPVYGQSLALGEEATRITDFDSLTNYADGRIVTEDLDHQFGYFDNDDVKQFAKKMIRYQKRSFELTIYSMAEMLADSTGKDTLICTFPGGQGATIISLLGKGSKPYQKFVEDIENAYKIAQSRGWGFVMPALCWMQGETDITSYPDTDYRKLLLQFVKDINDDVKQITGQKQDVEIICYQTGPVTRAKRFNALSYNCQETVIPQTFLELVRDNPLFHASGPMYPYTYVREAIHIDGIGHQQHGKLVALSAIDILRHQNHIRGLIPLSIAMNGNDAVIKFNVPCPPLVIDTIQVSKADNYGFSVINRQNMNIAESIVVGGDSVIIHCSESPKGCRIRYAVNGDYMKSGRLHGPRGNLRDSQGESITINIQGKKYPIHNWCYQFDMHITVK